MRFQGFIGPSYTLQSVNVDAQRCINFYPEMDEAGTGKEKEQYSLVGTPGLSLLASLGSGPVRGTYTATNGTLYVVSGNTLYSLDSNWNQLSVGQLLTTSGPVSMDDNGIQMFLVDGPNGYYVTLGAASIQTDILTVNTADGAHTYTGTVTGVGWSVAPLGGSPTIAQVATAIASAIGAISGTPVAAVASGAAVTITSLPPGSAFTDTTTDPDISITSSTTNFAVITDPGFLGADVVSFQDAYFIFNKPNTQEFYLSDLNAVSFTDGDVGSKEGYSDNIVGLISDHLNLYIFGSISSEIFYDSGNAFPFSRIQGAILPVGCLSAFSITLLQGSIYWLGCDKDGRGQVYRTQGYQAQRISTHALENVLEGISAANLSSARAWTYVQQGHAFYCLSFPGGESTWVFDAITNLWHERTSLILGNIQRHRGDCSAFAYATNVVGDYQNGNLYAIDPGTYTDNGTAIQRVRAAPHLSAGLNRVFHSKFQLDMETGVGTDGTNQGNVPQAILQWSNDGGHTWSNEHMAAIGPIGATKVRVIWRRLGNARDRVYRVIISDPVKCTLLGAELELQPGVA